jgi:hypothetical protein
MRLPLCGCDVKPVWTGLSSTMKGIAIGTTLLASGALAADDDAKPNRILIEYVQPTKPENKILYDLLKERRALESIQEIFSPFRLQNDLTVKSAECGMVNAWYQRPTVTICYEYLDDILKNMPKETTPTGLTPNDTVIGQFMYVVTHEMGHAMFDQLNVPLFGRPEDAADQFAAYMMLKLGKDQARRLIGGAAFSYKEYVEKIKVTVPSTAFADVHGAPMQRFYNLLCMAYGGDRDSFSDLVEKGYLPEDRARGCKVEYGEVNFAFQQLIFPHLDPQLAKAVMEKTWLPDAKSPPPRVSDKP